MPFAFQACSPAREACHARSCVPAPGGTWRRATSSIVLFTGPPLFSRRNASQASCFLTHSFSAVQKWLLGLRWTSRMAILLPAEHATTRSCPMPYAACPVHLTRGTLQEKPSSFLYLKERGVQR